MAKQIILTQNNFGIPIELQFVSNTNSPIDLTDKTIEVAISYDGTVIDVLQATISSYTNGTAYILTTTKHTSNVGLYTTFWSVRDKYGYITAQSDLYYYVKEEYNGASSTGQGKGTIEEKFDKVNSSIETLVEENSGISTRVSDIETINTQLTNNIKTINTRLTNNIKTINSQLDNKVNKSDIETINSRLDTIENEGTTVEVIERVTKEEIERQIADGTLANLSIADGSITKEKLAEDIEFGVADGSITSEKLNGSIFGVTYILQGVEKTWLSYNFIKLKQRYSNCKLGIKFDYTPKNKIFFHISTNKYNGESSNKFVLDMNVKTTIDIEIELVGEKDFDIIKLETRSSGLESFDGTLENLNITIDGNVVSYEILEPPIGTCEKVFETDLSIANKTYVNNNINKIAKDIALKSNIYDLTTPVSINQADNLKLIFDEDFLVGNAEFNYNNCTYGSSDGMTMVANSTIEYKYDVAVDTFRQKFIVKVLNANSIFGITTSCGANFMIDCANNKILSTIKVDNNIKTTEFDLEFNIELNKYYILEVIKDGLTHNFTIYDKSTGKRTSCSKFVEYPWGVGKVGFKCESGTVQIINYKYYQALFKNPLAIFIGDSITEGIGMGTYDISKRWCSLIRDNYFKGNALIFGKGYDTSQGALTRLTNLYRQGYSSKYVFIMIGTNECSDSKLVGWKENIVKIYNLIKSNNALPIIITPPLSRTNVNYVVQMKEFIQEKGWDTIRMDLALSVNNDGITYDNQYYKDGTHPNVQGGQLMYERALFDLDMIM